jgi:restriction system protein
MDYSPIINQFASVFWYLIPIAILLAILKSSWFKGVFGEFIVNFLAKLLLDKKAYHLIKNVTLLTKDGTTQIDHIIVSVYGIFVIETKNMKGWIFGNPNQRTWTQKIYKHSNKFQNPLHQNYKHVKTLESLLGLKEGQVHSLIVFVGDSTFKTEMPENVRHTRGYIRYIKSKKTCVLSQVEVEEIISKIKIGRLTPSFKTHREHVTHVKNIVSKKL